MRHVSLTCKNHPHLRWSTKSIAISNGKYNRARTLFFCGKISDPIKFYSDMSGVDCEDAEECNCNSWDSLIIAPEDKELQDAYIVKYDDQRTN